MSDSFWPHRLQHARIPCPSLFPEICRNACPLSRWCHPTISSSVAPFSCPQSFPASGSFPMSRLFASGGWSIGAQHQSFQWILRVDFLWDWLAWFPCCQRGSQKSSPAPQFESINSSVLNLLYGPNLISLDDYWKNFSNAKEAEVEGFYEDLQDLLELTPKKRCPFSL